jgi:ribosomal protein S18 acetylase RimI-like enzyme
VEEDAMIALRSVRLPDDRAQLLALDRSFMTDRVYRVLRTADSFTLETVTVDPPIRKELPLAEYLGDGRMWEEGIVAQERGAIIGFAAFAHREWNRRTELWHLYVAAARRREGIGRILVESVIVAARAAGTRSIWLETSTLAYPAIQFYRRLGFTLCGLDISLYDPSGAGAGETALYFARDLSDANDAA